jgi:hypothetical protein
MKKKMITIVVLTALNLSTVTAEEESPFSYILETNYLTSYVAPPGILADKDPVIQSSLTAIHESGIYGNIWHSGSANYH